MKRTRSKHINIEDNPQYIENPLTDISTLNWKTLNDVSIINLKETLINDIQKYINNGLDKSTFKFIVASDSQRHDAKITYVTSIIFLRLGHGGNAYCLKEHYLSEDLTIKNLTRSERLSKVKNAARERLWTECLKSIACAKWVDNILFDFGLKVSEIHSDVNFSKKYLSNELLNAITGFITSQEYKSVIKPESWGASKIADRKTK